MSQPMPYYPPSDFELLSMEEQIDYVEANLPRLTAELMAEESIPLWHREILVEVLINLRSQFEGGITLEDYQRKRAKS